MVICSGPGNDEESSFHEKMYMIVREGPIHRCIMCGQCFKLQVLKDSISNAENEYYSVVFTDISPKVVSEPEAMPYQLHAFVSHDYQMNQYNISPNDRAYVMVSAILKYRLMQMKLIMHSSILLTEWKSINNMMIMLKKLKW